MLQQNMLNDAIIRPTNGISHLAKDNDILQHARANIGILQLYVLSPNNNIFQQI